MRVAVAGLGWATRSFHLPGLARNSDVTLVGGADPSAAAREWWQRSTDTSAFRDAGEMLRRPGPRS